MGDWLAAQVVVKWFVAGDPLRGLATVSIVGVHAGSAALNATGYGVVFAGDPGRLAAYGDLAGSLQVSGAFSVWIFFVLSGYLVGRPFVHAVIEGRPRPSIARFARKRALRILPPYWTVLTLVVLFTVAVTASAQISTGRLAALYAFVVHGDNPLWAWTAHMWTLEAEAIFYVTLPCVVLAGTPLLRRLPSRRARAIAICIPFVAWTLATAVHVEEAIGVDWLRVFRFFAGGMALAAIELFAVPRVRNRDGWKTAATVLFTAAFVCLLVLPPLRYLVGGTFDGGVGDALLVIGCDLAVTSVVGAALLRQWTGAECWSLVNNRFTRWLGTRSYSFYLVHYALVFELSVLIARAGHGYKVTLALLFPATLIASGVLAELLYRTVERPFVSFKSRPRRVAAPSRTAVEQST